MQRPSWARGGAAPPARLPAAGKGNYGPCRNNIAGGQKSHPFPPQPPQRPPVSPYAPYAARPQQPLRAAASQQPVARNAKSSLPALEAQFTQGADALYEGLMDLALPTTQLAMQWKELLSLRSQLQQAHNVMVRSPAGVGGGAGAGAKFMQPVGLVPTAQEWSQQDSLAGLEKSKLREFYEKRVRKEENRSVEKDEVVYETVEAESGGFTSSVQLGTLGPFMSEEPHKSKKEAEQAAARVALRELFPDASFQQAQGKRHGGQQPQQGTERKKGQPPEEPKARLVWAVQLLLGQASITKGAIVYETQEVDDPTGQGRYQASVCIPEFDSSRLWHGETQPTKKAAEASAAAFAFADIETDIAPLVEEQKEKKKQKSQASLEALKLRHAEKKAAQKGSADVDEVEGASGGGEEDAHNM